MREWKFFEWDYGKRTVVQWKRLGECNQCGDCCRAEIRYIGTEWIGQWAWMGKTVGNEQGIWIEARSGNHRLFMSPVLVDQTNTAHACRLLVKGGCKAHKQKAKKAPLCDLWPIHPSQVEVFPRCSYSFEKVLEEDF